MFGLRALFFVMDDLVRLFEFLKLGIAFVLVFIGVELMASRWIDLSSDLVLGVISSAFVLCIGASAVKWAYSPSAKGSAATEEPSPSADGTGAASGAIEAGDSSL